MKTKPTVIDLFCGCGGLSYGFAKAGYEILMGVDSWDDAIQTFKGTHKNAQGVVADLFTDTPKELATYTQLKDIDVIIGGPPCQGFSIAGKRIVDDKRNKLYKSFIGFVEYYKPKIFLMENVPNIVSIGKGVVKDNIIMDFENLGYSVVYKVLLASEFGVPQNRKRAFFIGITGDREFTFPKPITKNPIVAKDAISDLPEHSVTDGTKYLVGPKSDYQKVIRGTSEGIYNHEVTNHSEKTRSIIGLVPDGGNHKDLPDEFRNTRNVNIAWTRLSSKKPSFTIDTGHRHHFHYEFNRVPTVRESARIQSFPDTFIFLGSKTSQYKQVGNAVPPILAEMLAKEIMNYL